MYLNKNVYLVDGFKNGALYDLNNGKLYQINEESKTLIHNIIRSPNFLLSDAEQDFVNDLQSKKLLTDSFVKPHDIKELAEKPSIEFAWIEITTLCNLKCIHCYNEADAAHGSTMNIAKFKHIIDEIEKFGMRKIQIIGGEPFVLQKNLFEYLDYCKEKFDYIEIFTNGTLISDEWIEYLKMNNINIALSVYSYEESEHNKVTKDSSSWKRTNETIKKLHSAKIKYRVKNVIMKDVEIGKPSTELYRLSYRKDIVRLTGRAKMNLLSDELLKRKLITKKNFAHQISEELVKKCISGHNCFSRRLYFSVDGNVYPCVMERRICHGNISDGSISKILKDEILLFSKDKVESCKDCELRYCCYDCRPDSNSAKINEKPWYCTYNPFTGMWEKDTDAFIGQLKK